MADKDHGSRGRPLGLGASGEPGNRVFVGSGRNLKGRVVVTGERARKLFLGPSPETVARIEELERWNRRSLHRMRDILLD